ncbi:uncharacterized protein EDB91DRAFT_1249413 [Suillus paluster]|uniref:uncharacterized protein n=1 Tax=Suillus paluster TaxID=48578 RepID=UPI001B865579|nr:uncharacterized protein EDB91DRAFT_1249413 [Suillus paluster]KAG1738104.1 hypothetical protein EDB91DRAFT_1249413 [Suillus paluster]
MPRTSARKDLLNAVDKAALALAKLQFQNELLDDLSDSDSDTNSESDIDLLSTDDEVLLLPLIFAFCLFALFPAPPPFNFRIFASLLSYILLPNNFRTFDYLVSFLNFRIFVQFTKQPSKYILDEKELERVSALARITLEYAWTELERAHNAAKSMGKGTECAEADEEDEEDVWVNEDVSIDGDVPVDGALAKGDDLAQYKLDEYDEDDVKEAGMGPFSDIKGLPFYSDNQDDPYITLKDVRSLPFPPSYLTQDPEDDERSKLKVLPTDDLLVTAKTEDDKSQDNLYVHRDLMLPNFPLCPEWLDFPPTSPSPTQPSVHMHMPCSTRIEDSAVPDGHILMHRANERRGFRVDISRQRPHGDLSFVLTPVLNHQPDAALT